MSEGTPDGRPGPVSAYPVIDLIPSAPAGEAHVSGAGGIYARAVRPALRFPWLHRYGRALLCFALTFLSTTTLGPAMYAASRGPADLVWLSPRQIVSVWTHPDVLATGLTFSLPALAILLCHEMGHYVTCRIYGIPCTPPYFLPFPFNFGTFGAFIRIKAPIHSKRQLFDVGIAGPLAGFVALVPCLLYGIAKSQPVPLPATSGESILYLGHCLAIELASRAFHGRLAPGMVLALHPVAMAAWLGLFATSLNLIPLGQLDGGHILYAALGRLQRRAALPLWLGLALLGFYWPGWLLWCVVVLVIGLFHPPVSDESLPLDGKRRALAVVALLLFVLCFIPVPIQELAAG
jgi:membrane-associated protease RseP (regulator of RpoE activity)